MYQQMLKNPNVAISGMAGSEWIRISGKAVMDKSDGAKQAMFTQLPALKEVYSFEELVPYYLADIKSVVSSFANAPMELAD